MSTTGCTACSKGCGLRTDSASFAVFGVSSPFSQARSSLRKYRYSFDPGTRCRGISRRWCIVDREKRRKSAASGNVITSRSGNTIPSKLIDRPVIGCGMSINGFRRNHQTERSGPQTSIVDPRSGHGDSAPRTVSRSTVWSEARGAGFPLKHFVDCDKLPGQ